MPEYSPRYLVMVTADSNANKYYRLTPHGDTWTAEYGRIGGSSQARIYPKSQWDSKYNEKIRKGYTDQTDLVKDLISEEAPESNPEFKEIENRAIAEIVDRLQQMAKQTIKENYTISSDKVTQAMVDEAQNILTGLLTIQDIDEFNDTLLKLYTVIPRKMTTVKSHMATDPSQFAEIISKEQDLLDVMKGQVVQKQVVEQTVSKEPINDKTILEHLGLIFEECTEDDVARIKSNLGSCANQFHNAWKVTNLRTQERFDRFVEENKIEDVRLLFHGSRNENWWSIINSGLMLKPTNAIRTGAMFGHGLYYAPKAQKSLGYTSLNGSYWAHGNSKSGFMALMNVAYGKPYDVHSFESKYGNFTYDILQKECPGANCVHAHAGVMLRNDEIIVYKEEQCTIKYLVELR